MTATSALVRLERTGERRLVRDVIVAAFDGEGPGAGERVAVLERSLRTSACGIDGLSFVADSGGEVLGHVLVTRGWVDTPDRLVEVGVLSPLAVHPGHQGRGLGGALVRRALSGAEEAGMPLVFLEGAPAYYGRFGFVPARTMGFTPPSVRIPDAGFQVVALPGYRSWMRGALVYPDPFWRHDCVGLRGAVGTPPG